MKRTRVNLYGLGAANLSVAISLIKSKKIDLHIYEQKKRGGNKFLVAGKGGFNLSHSKIVRSNRLYPERCRSFIGRYIDFFDINDFIELLYEHNIPTYIGSSGKLFPEKGIKPIDVYNRLMRRIEKEATIHYNSKFIGFGDNGAIKLLNSNEQLEIISADVHVLGFGGCSWSKTGSDGLWISSFEKEKINVTPFSPSNSGLEILWTESILPHSGKPLKNIKITFNDKSIRGEALVTNYGLEGNAIYPFANEIFNHKQPNWISIDWKPDIPDDDWLEKCNKLDQQLSTSNFLLKLGLNKTAIAIIKSNTSKQEWLDRKTICSIIKNFKLKIEGVRPMDEAISTSGGVSLNELLENLELSSKKGCYCVGEMIDWDAPTGGYLLQACFSMGQYVASDIISKL